MRKPKDAGNTEVISRSGSRAAATSKMECFVIIVNDFQPITIITKHSIFDVASVLIPPLIRQNYLLQGKENTSKQGKICHFEVSLQVSLQLFSKSH